MTDTTKRLITLAAKRFNVNASTLQPTDDFFEKLKIDSVAALNLLSDVEAEFKVEIPDYELQDVKTFEQLAKVIQTRLSC
jgi:acyl carrier protein